jgi:hypothetical protein
LLEAGWTAAYQVEKLGGALLPVQADGFACERIRIERWVIASGGRID